MKKMHRIHHISRGQAEQRSLFPDPLAVLRLPRRPCRRADGPQDRQVVGARPNHVRRPLDQLRLVREPLVPGRADGARLVRENRRGPSPSVRRPEPVESRALRTPAPSVLRELAAEAHERPEAPRGREEPSHAIALRLRDGTPVDLRQVQAVLELLGELLEQRAELEGVDLSRG